MRVFVAVAVVLAIFHRLQIIFEQGVDDLLLNFLRNHRGALEDGMCFNITSSSTILNANSIFCSLSCLFSADDKAVVAPDGSLLTQAEYDNWKKASCKMLNLKLVTIVFCFVCSASNSAGQALSVSPFSHSSSNSSNS